MRGRLVRGPPRARSESSSSARSATPTTRRRRPARCARRSTRRSPLAQRGKRQKRKRQQREHRSGAVYAERRAAQTEPSTAAGRAEREPLEPGERPLPVTIGAIVAVALVVVQ